MAGITLITDPDEGVVGDVSFLDGNMSLQVEKDAIILEMKQALKFFFTEWFLDKRKGIPYIQRIFIKNPDPELLDTIFKDVILNVNLVTRITQWSLQVDTGTREMRLSFKADSTFGEIEFSDKIGTA